MPSDVTLSAADSTRHPCVRLFSKTPAALTLANSLLSFIVASPEIPNTAQTRKIAVAAGESNTDDSIDLGIHCLTTTAAGLQRNYDVSSSARVPQASERYGCRQNRKLKKAMTGPMKSLAARMIRTSRKANDSNRAAIVRIASWPKLTSQCRSTVQRPRKAKRWPSLF